MIPTGDPLKFLVRYSLGVINIPNPHTHDIYMWYMYPEKPPSYGAPVDPPHYCTSNVKKWSCFTRQRPLFRPMIYKPVGYFAA